MFSYHFNAQRQLYALCMYVYNKPLAVVSYYKSCNYLFFVWYMLMITNGALWYVCILFITIPYHKRIGMFI